MVEDRRAPLASLTLIAILTLIGVLLSQCGGWEDVGPAPDDPFPDDDDAATPAPTITLTPEVLPGPVLNPDAGWVAHNPNQSWTSLVDRAGGEPFRVASVIYTRAGSAEWAAPTDGSDPEASASGPVAGRVGEVIDHGRYAAFRLHASTVDDLPPGWATTTDEAEVVPDGLISLVQVGGAGDDDDSSSDDDDDSSSDDDDSSSDDDDSAAVARDEALWVPNYADPDYRDLHAAQITALADRFAGQAGLAFVDIGGVGEEGGWDFASPDVWFGGPTPIFNEVSWAASVQFYADLYESIFPDVPLYISWRAVANAGSAAGNVLDALVLRGVHLRDDCVGCVEPDFDRFPDEGSDDPYPSTDPYGGWLPAELWPQHALQYEAIDDGFGSWRLADRDGEWDEAAHGPFATWFARMLDVRLRYAPPSLVSLSGTACTSEWVIAAAPPATACASQAPGAIWAPLLSYGERFGYRYVVTQVRLAPNWQELEELEVELDVVNQGAARAFVDREVELAFVDGVTGVALDPVSVALPAPTSDWLPDQLVSLSAALPLQELDFAEGASWDLTIRVLEPRAFGGGIALPHPAVTEEARFVVASWPFDP